MTTITPTSIRPSVTHAGDAESSTAFPGLPGRFCLHYQPVIDLRTGAIASCEALLRWRHPDFGVLRPRATLGGTRWTDQIADLEEWALGEVCRQGAAWEHDGTQIQIALNVSHTFVLSPRFHANLDQAITQTGVTPRILAIDLPVGALATYPVEVRQIAADLSADDVGVIIDGVAGDSCPWAIDRIQADGWKIQLAQSNPEGSLHPSVQRAVDHAHATGALAIAKAVEDDTALAGVRAAGFDAAFGDVLAAPVTAREAWRTFRPAPQRLGPLFRHPTR